MRDSASRHSNLACFTLSRWTDSEADKGQRKPGNFLRLLHSLSLSLSLSLFLSFTFTNIPIFGSKKASRIFQPPVL